MDVGKLMAIPMPVGVAVRLQGYDTTIIPLVIMIILMSVAALAGLVGLLVFHVRAAFYARPLNFHADVLHQQ
jgi:hypothetical protein